MKQLLKIYKIYYIFFFPIYILIRIISPFYLIRFERLISNRIGHFVCTTELYLCEIENKKNIPQEKFLDIFTINDEVCNSQVLKFWKKKIIFFNHYFVDPILFFIRVIPGSDKHRVFYRKSIKEENNLFAHRDTMNLIDKSQKHFFFENYEKQLSIENCKKLKIPLNKKLALIHLRDNYYFKRHHKNTNFDYWAQKNPNIDDFIPSIKHLIKNNYFVIRVGKGSQKKLKIKNKNFIDITNHKLRTDLLESYLCSVCKIYIGSNSGAWISTSYLYRKPTYTPNFLPVGALYNYSKNMFCNFKLIKDKKTKKILNLSEIKKLGLLDYQHTNLYKKHNLIYVDISPEDLKRNINEFILKVENKWKIKKDEKKIKEKFIKFYCNLTKEFKINGKFKSDVGYFYLKKNYKWLLK